MKKQLFPLPTSYYFIFSFLTLVVVTACSSSNSPVEEPEIVDDSSSDATNDDEVDTDEAPDGDTDGTQDDNANDDSDTDSDSSVPPSDIFNLSTWNISIPTDTDNSGTADTISENDLNNGYEDPAYFYTADDGGMVFKCPVEGFKTSVNTSYVRTELREMLRAGNTSIPTKGVNKNNWVFGSAPQSDISAAGGYDGELKATLAVNHVTTTGSSNQVGRVIVGQIHANDDEPVRLYYRKLPNNDLGSIYIAHEENADDEFWYEIIGSRSSSADNPSDGIALDEKFSYAIKVVGNDMWVTISREGKEDVEQYVDMTTSGYDVGGQYMYFKAGVYNQNNTGDATDYVQATFYSLSNSHSN
ncbi:polysaccharide lyase family 7 protein [Flagellimonas sp. HMM57]|uniref:polysaccharide lyase family 7 protein n=1 Tax=unclassified Flagellimonas TaxID=2644544 RepID=UPI0013D1078D|nr:MULTISPECIES: polysaccharide lyase family 7 protein [unclassified Flagellimonas]UII75826.1 polysaccharide lyase family 7 protein [Flagellimonas sp. HMM57]